MNEELRSKIPYKPDDYDHYITYTLPFIRDMYGQVVSMVKNYGNTRGKMLDLGCGTGMLEKLIREALPELSIVAVDPSEKMLQQAREKQIPNVEYQKGISQEITYEDEFDLVTAIMSHHFMQADVRRETTAKVYKALKENGIFLCFENVIPEDSFIKDKELSRWEAFQIKAGKDAEEAAEHRARCGVFYFPITVEEHVDLLKKVGFRYVYVFWRSYMQMGIMGIK